MEDVQKHEMTAGKLEPSSRLAVARSARAAA
jgi:hypothetical protein